ncbi:hypothetical protein TraAM80_02894 [Trypanosoma rangeli]|uniref:Uncharacterized protein n=1 Tax=Trypanosoma rangeli TaxID=5698 RepID=A0A3R7M311_TRYRA|nr:uncharacterized protein TraAM80_02894 [Trypanosoma rangeli]RNF08137.1 hypothetical protein TraAM80_02894 [Trypanosoma rangeli]|eukprot:RNF08137.1 hypothetical protein TraAM80_02894 [Trypanosoma rangeli]
MTVGLVPHRPVRLLSSKEFVTRMHTLCKDSSVSWVVTGEAAPMLVMGIPRNTLPEIPAATSAADSSPPRCVSVNSRASSDSDVHEVSPWSSKKCPPSAAGGKGGVTRPPAQKTVPSKVRNRTRPMTAGTKRQRSIENFLARQR